MRVARIAVLATVAAIAAFGGASASANTLRYTGTITSTDLELPFVPFDTNGPTTCASSPNIVGIGVPAHIDEYAFRNLGGDGCITVTGESPDCNVLFAIDASVTNHAFAGTDADCSPSDGTRQHTFNVSAGQEFFEFVVGNPSAPADIPYGLSVSGDNVAPENAIQVSGAGLPGNQTLNAFGSSLENSVDPRGTLSVSQGPSSYSGPIKCLRAFDSSTLGQTASAVVRFDHQDIASRFVGAVFWFNDSPTGTSGQRNSVLTQAAYDKLGTDTAGNPKCPDPTKPVGGTFRTLASGGIGILPIPPETPAT